MRGKVTERSGVKKKKKEQGLDDLGNSQPIWMAKDAKIKEQSLLGKHVLEKKPLVWLLNLLLTPQKDQKVRMLSHKRFLEETVIRSFISSQKLG